MHNAAPSPAVTTSTSSRLGEDLPTRPQVQRATTSDILEYYNSPEASTGYSASDMAQLRTSQQHSSSQSKSPDSREEPSNQVSAEQDQDQASRSKAGSIRLVPSKKTQTSPLDVRRRPALHHADSIDIVAENRRIAIIERDVSPVPSDLPLTTSTSSTKIIPSPPPKRGVDHMRLALVSPPDSAPLTSSPQSSPPSAATFAHSKLSRSRAEDARVFPPTQATNSPQYYMSREARHGRSSSDGVSPLGFQSVRTPITGNLSSTVEGVSKTSREAGAASTARTVRDPVPERRNLDQHRDRPSSGSDYGDDSTTPQRGKPPKDSPLYKPGSQTFHTQTNTSSKPHPSTSPRSATTSGMHIPLPVASSAFGLSRGQTPMLTPAIGDTKPIDLKVAAPVVTDINSDLADLWLAANPDGEAEAGGSAMGSPMTALTTTTDSSLQQTFSPISQHSSTTSPLQLRGKREPARDASLPSPPRRINVNMLSPSISPVCPPRPQRQASPVKTNSSTSLRQDDASSTSSISSQKASDDPTHRQKNNIHLSAEASDSKYSLSKLSDDESASEYSRDAPSKSVPSSLSKSGSIHIREGAFPPNSVFLDRLKTDNSPAQVSQNSSDWDMETPTKRTNLVTMFDQASKELHQKAERHADQSLKVTGPPRTSSKQHHGHMPNEDPSTQTRPLTAESQEDEDAPILFRSSSLRPNLPPKDSSRTIKPQRSNVFDGDGKMTYEEFLTESPRTSAENQRVYAQSDLGHGPPPSGRRYLKGSIAFKAKGPLATSGTLRSGRSKAATKPRSMWPSAMSFADVISETTVLARAIGYATKFNELATEDCGLGDWIDEIVNRARPPVMTTEGPVPVGPPHSRLVSGSSATSDMTFPIRPGAHKVVDLLAGDVEMSSSEVPSTLPYPSLALRQHMTGSQIAIPPSPSTKSSISSVVKNGPASLFATLGRKASMRPKGSQSATETREKEPRSTPRKLVSSRSPALRANDTPSHPTPPTMSSSLPAVGPSLPGGPRAPRPKRASTMMISAPRPIISNPIPIISAPVTAHPTSTEFDRDTDLSDFSNLPPITPYNLTTVPRAPEGPRPLGKVTRTPSFPGSARVSSGGNLRSTASFRPSAPPSEAPKSTVGHAMTEVPSRSPPMEHTREFKQSLDMLCDIMPNVARETLAVYLAKADGLNMVAIGRYLEDERQGKILKA
ncbi:hypothetical protein CPB86DRAFT_816454 [Serendipita vermifera]|nr:hypothetical protein CPB86DRAFT_816454 [Serendipita vermifera]